MDRFSAKLRTNNLELTRKTTGTLQVNLGLLCNQSCNHCHLEAGPGRSEMMDQQTVSQVIDYVERAGFPVVDITGGAPELNPHLRELISGVMPLAEKVILRANLTALGHPDQDGLMEFLAANRVVIVASFAAVNQFQTDAQRGKGVFHKSLECLKRLNRLGYGRPESGLELDLVSNPAGAFLPPDQDQVSDRFRKRLKEKYGIVFNDLYTFANVPLGRFQTWLKDSGNYDAYLSRLASSFNPASVEGLMCRDQVSVAWDGQLYDCDFNLAAGLPLGGRPTHMTELEGAPQEGAAIAMGDHCYTCTAGAGFT